jgi:hypothetical protein
MKILKIPSTIIVVLIIGHVSMSGFQYMTDQDRKEIGDLRKIQPPPEAIELKLIKSFPSAEQEAAGIYIGIPDSMAFDKEGNIYVTDQKENAVHKFDSMGKYLARIGKPGQGPGDLSIPRQIRVFDDEFVVFDAGNRRLQYFDLQGKYLRTKRINKTYYDLSIIGDGQVIGAPLPNGYQEKNDLVDVISPEGKIIRSFGAPIEFKFAGATMNQTEIFVNNRNEIVQIFTKLDLLRKYSLEGRLLLEKKSETEFSLLKDRINRRLNSYLPNERVGYLPSVRTAAILDDHIFIVDHVPPRMWIWEYDESLQRTRTYWANVGESSFTRDLIVIKENNQIKFFHLGMFGDEVMRVNIFVPK